MPKDTMHWKADRMKRPKPLESLILTIRDHRVMIDPIWLTSMESRHER
jgi:hypothetical protein